MHPYFVPGFALATARFALATVIAAAGPAFAQPPSTTPNAQQPTQETPAQATDQSTQPADSHEKAHNESADTKALQLALDKQGAHLKADGVMGPKTRDALRDYQRKNGLKATGTLDEETEAKLGIQ